jgi:hypothetical protein
MSNGLNLAEPAAAPLKIFERGWLELLAGDGAGQRLGVVGVNSRIMARAAHRDIEPAGS